MQLGPPQIGSNAPIPYFAPWAAQFNRYSTQIVNLARRNAAQYDTTIPDGQWWRLAFIESRWTTSATAGSRLAQTSFQTPDGQTVFVFAPAVQGVSLGGYYLYGPNLSAYSVTIAGNTTSQVIPVPDLMWAPGTLITVLLTNNQTGDVATNTPFVAAEIYTEHIDTDTGTAVLIPTPVLT